jgi:hypothetical protein
MKFTIVVKVSQTDPSEDWTQQFEHEFFTWEAAVFEAVAQVKALNDNDSLTYELVSVVAAAHDAQLAEAKREGAREALTAYARVCHAVGPLWFRDNEYSAIPSGQMCGYCKRQIAANELFCSDDCAEAFGSADSQSFIDGELADRERRAEDRDRYGY